MKSTVWQIKRTVCLMRGRKWFLFSRNFIAFNSAVCFFGSSQLLCIQKQQSAGQSWVQHWDRLPIKMIYSWTRKSFPHSTSGLLWVIEMAVQSASFREFHSETWEMPERLLAHFYFPSYFIWSYFPSFVFPVYLIHFLFSLCLSRSPDLLSAHTQANFSWSTHWSYKLKTTVIQQWP